MAHITYKAAKKNADVWRDDHIISLAQSRADKKAPLLKLNRKHLPTTLVRNSKLFGSKPFARNCDKRSH
jgi:hypothetical protein